MKTKAEIIEQNNLNPHLIEGFEAHEGNPLLTIIFKLKDKESKKVRLHFNMVTGEELTSDEVRCDSWSGEDIGSGISTGRGEKIPRKPKQRRKPKRIEKKGKN